MARKNKQAPIDQKMTLAEARARIDEFKPIKRIEGKGVGAPVPASKGGKRDTRKEQR